MRGASMRTELATDGGESRTRKYPWARQGSRPKENRARASEVDSPARLLTKSILLRKSREASLGG